jgi:hypothetical protein
MCFKQHLDIAAPWLKHNPDIGVCSAATILHSSRKSSILPSLIPANEVIFFHLW